MNQDFPLSTQAQTTGDFWTQGPAAAIAPYAPAAPGKTSGAQTAKPSPMQKMHRLLRGRYPLAIMLAAAGAVTGALAGFMALPPRYESAGYIEVNPMVITPSPGDNVMPMLAYFIQTQVDLIKGSDVADQAVKDPAFVDAWDKAYPNAPMPATADIIAATDPEHIRNGALIRVSFTDKNKAVAEAGCTAVLKAYMDKHGANDPLSSIDERIAFNNEKLATCRKDLQYKTQELNGLSEKYGTTDLEERNKTIQNNLVTVGYQVINAKNAYEDAKNMLDGKPLDNAPPDKETVYLQIAAYPDLRMQNLLQRREDSKLQLERLSTRIGPNNPAYVAQQVQLSLDQQDIDDYARNFRVSHPNFIGANLVDGSITADGVDRLKKQYESAKKIENDLKLQATDLGFQIGRISEVRDRLRAINHDIDTYQSYNRDLEARKNLNRPMVLVNSGDEAQIPTDKRKLAAGIGFTFGGLLPLGLMLLYGLSENKFRFSDDANEHDMLGTTLLGILPNLPDRLSDPQQAGVAAHCVHQIRTMLQISRSNDEPQVLAITSASSGDGKTSLCLALGLSYAACGARTLLVDCDLVAAGLTHRLNVNSTDGVLEAVANRALLEYVRTTDIADVAILPVGTTHAHHASTLSPVALRRLISEGKKHFDIIIIDTGPLLGSIEASLVCAAADRSILAVARNQQRPLVERSIRHLQEIGAELAGVVFNRAHASDFERSMSGLALRSRPATAAGTAGQASAAKAVAGSFKRAG